MLKKTLENSLIAVILKLYPQLKRTWVQSQVRIEPTKEKRFGDFATPIALSLAKEIKCQPRDVAQKIVESLSTVTEVQSIEIAGPGFINFFLVPNAFQNVVKQILALGQAYGRSGEGEGKSVLIEFVSANPTGPLHVGHGRGAAYGDVIANLLEAVGFQVVREYYVNDAGRQMDILAVSVWLRYLELSGESITFPTNGYQGDYVYDIAADLHREVGTLYHHPIATLLEGLPLQPSEEERESYMDRLIQRTRELLGEKGYEVVHGKGLRAILDDIEDDLRDFGVTYDQWFSERALTQRDSVKRVIERLKAQGHLYEQKGAWWFRSTAFGDEKDRVVIRENGQPTYFASDIAYHLEKLERGFDALINIWGADHHGYVARVKGALAALGENPDRLTILLCQFVILYRDGERLSMSTRSGEFVTLRALRHEVGQDATRFFYVLRRAEQHLDFDLNLAKSQSLDNPVYYIQYAHARIASLFREVESQKIPYRTEQIEGLEHLTDRHEEGLLKLLVQYPEVVQNAALQHEPHQLVHYLTALAQSFHAYYNACPFLGAEESIRNARLALNHACQQVLRNGLNLLAITAPDSM